jgi:hypothetical protein
MMMVSIVVRRLETHDEILERVERTLTRIELLAQEIIEESQVPLGEDDARESGNSKKPSTGN